MRSEAPSQEGLFHGPPASEIRRFGGATCLKRTNVVLRLSRVSILRSGRVYAAPGYDLGDPR
jgi:hypothetical protein